MPASTLPNAEPTALLRTTDGLPIPLDEVRATGRLEGYLFELTVEQRYLNRSDRNLEAVFTFPVPLRAVLLGFELEIGARKLTAATVARAEATERYERGVAAGDAAALIEPVGNGLYTVSLGNLLPGETALVRYRYAELLDGHDGRVRINVPTAIAPRYGDPRDAGLEGPATPGTLFFAEYRFGIEIELPGVMDPAGVSCPSHAIRFDRRGSGLCAAIAKRGFLDRDFVLEIERAAVPSAAIVSRDERSNGYVALASTSLDADPTEREPAVVKILVDCSGSMAGASIDGAKRAILAILDQLTPDDRISLTRFGATVEHVTEGLESADRHTVNPLRTLVRRMQADLGGTELRNALAAVLEIDADRDRGADVILITDGEIYEVQAIVKLAARSGHRLFTVAVGAAPVEALHRAVADETGGACEFVAPGEDPGPAILRTFGRLRACPRKLESVAWPATPTWTAPLPSAVFPGDTIHLMAHFEGHPAGAVDVTFIDSRGKRQSQQLAVATTIIAGDVLARVAVARRIGVVPKASALDLALQYEIVTDQTALVVVAERAAGEQARDLPATVAVPHMLAAGWGGTVGMLRAGAASADLHVVASGIESVAQARHPSSAPADKPAYLHDAGDRWSMSEPVVSARDDYGRELPRLDAAARRDALRALYRRYAQGDALPRSVWDLVEFSEMQDIVPLLLSLTKETGYGDEEIVAMFLAMLARDEIASGFDLAFRKALRRGTRGRWFRHRSLRRAIRQLVFA